ncbi:3-isopropylmalate dehydratase large subunit [Olavius algarvensis spirochete endosymbiont]|uniref:3-isopropylmalate dehydratase large subunit n=1 Tax=Olavius algarvensis spirochete endosymbiont TaxID=260710 RepID=UPI00052D7B0C|nr:3-isopropylmalate dehydratase large subunit [Olavius algarvensis spirochete endosymbiont]KGM44345.1 isopropylmalate isomerase [Alkalispirochaeta odontotermitis]VDB00357.1 3-isopropylmalate dehydratase large subunit [Olavius algarvensis spirochete endosymbiont]
MSGKSLFEKVWLRHKVRTLPSGQDQLFIGLHLIHEVTSPQAFAMLQASGQTVPFSKNTFATIDHIIPTDTISRPYSDPLAEKMLKTLEDNTKRYGITYFGPESGKQGVVHVVGPEKGLTQPGMTIACGDSHTATHGAFGAIAFGVGTSQVRDILATQTMAIEKLKVRRIVVNGRKAIGVSAKDIILTIIRLLGITSGLGYAYEYAGEAITELSMEERMTLCNMSIEGGARVGYVNPDDTTYKWLEDRPFVKDYDSMKAFGEEMKSDVDAVFDDEVVFSASEFKPMITWGINPGQAVAIDESLPQISLLPASEKENARRAYEHMGFSPGEKMVGKKIDVVFIGSCTNGRLSDLREAASVVRGRRIAAGVRALVVPGSQEVAAAAESEDLDVIFTEAGFEWRQAGCSMCLAMNPDRLEGRQLSASTSNRNFIGRQGSPTGRTLLMSPAMAAAAAIAGEVVDIRETEPV